VWQADAPVTPEELQAITDRVVERAEPGEQLEAVATWSRETEVRAYNGEVEHFVSADSAGIGVRIIRDGRQGLAWAGVLDEDSLATVVAEARDNSGFGTPDPDSGLAEPDGVEAATITLFDERLLTTPTEEKIRLAVELERLTVDGDPRMAGIESSDYADAVVASAIASTTGVRVAGHETSAYVGVYALGGGDDDVTTGFGFSVGRAAEDLDVEVASAEAVERCMAMLGARKAPSERLTVVFTPYVASQFLGLVAELLSGEAALRGRSPFAGRTGEVVAAPSITLYDDPTDAAAPTASDIDDEGLACRRVDLITDGVLGGFLQNAYTARASGTVSTGSAQRGSHRSAPGVGPRVVKVSAGSQSPEQIMAGVGAGLLVTELAGLHSGVNPVSGDLSVGIEGRRITGGAAAEPIREVTIGSTLQRMLGDVVAIGSDVVYFPWEATGLTLAIADVTMSGS